MLAGAGPMCCRISIRLSGAKTCRPTLTRNGSKRQGMLAVNYPTYVHPITRAFIEAGVRDGLPASQGFERRDFRRHQPDAQFGAQGSAPIGCGSIFASGTGAEESRGGNFRACSAFLTEGRRATGIEYERDGTIQKALAKREVILAAGSIGSPQILMLSGIGPGKHLQEHGIAVVADVPGVGENLHDHPYTTCTYRTAPENSLNPQLSGLRVVGHAINYYLAKRGPLTNGASQATALTRGLLGRLRALICKLFFGR